MRRLLLFVAPLLFIAWMLWIRLEFRTAYEDFNREDHVIQNLQVLFYAASAIVFLVAARGIAGGLRYARWLLIVAAVALVFIVGEEIQWGEDIFHFAPPAFFAQHNAELELNLHNLAGIDSRLDYAFIAAGLLGGFAWLVPGRLLDWMPLRRSLVPPWYLALYFLPVAAFGFLWKAQTVPSFLGGVFWNSGDMLGGLIWQDQEPAELLFAAACLILAIRALRNTGQESPTRGV